MYINIVSKELKAVFRLIVLRLTAWQFNQTAGIKTENGSLLRSGVVSKGSVVFFINFLFVE